MTVGDFSSTLLSWLSSDGLGTSLVLTHINLTGQTGSMACLQYFTGKELEAQEGEAAGPNPL